MKLLALYWSCLIIGYAAAAGLRRRGIVFSWVQRAIMLMICALCFLMGLRMGINDEVISNLGTIGLSALIISVFCVVGSMGAITLTRKMLGMDRWGNIIKASADTGRDSGAKESGDDKGESLRITLIIIVFIGGGIAAGVFVIAGKYPEFTDSFDRSSSTALVVLLCMLLFLVGFDLGASGSIFANLKIAGPRLIAFPLAAVFGTMAVGVAACVVMGFSLREGTAICMGFGWYTYAPVVIAGAGRQYMIAGAVSFMHNLIRETAGIILIPLIARKIGYLEATGVPGVAAMDVCMPIVERSCRSDTVIYSFGTGLFMCLVTSIGTPIVMSL